MYAMKYPHRFTADELVLPDEKQAIAGIPPSPSLSGFAFICCAAALPLLISRDIIYGLEVSQLCITAFPYIVEPFSRKQRDADSNDSFMFSLTDIDKFRIQHLLNRIEQVSICVKLCIFDDDSFTMNIDFNCV